MATSPNIQLLIEGCRRGSHKFGMGFKYAPVYGIGRAKVPFSKKLFMFKSAEIRSAYYKRSTGLNAFIVSLGLSFGIK